MKRISILLFFASLLGVAGGNVQAVDRQELKWVRRKPIIDSIQIDGNEFFKDSELKKRMYSRKRTVMGWLKGDRRTKVQRETLRRDTLEIKYAYLTEGFLDIKVSERFEMLNEDSAALVRITIDEGRRFFYGVKEISGHYDRKFHKDLTRIANRLKQSKPIDLFALRQASLDMKTVFANHGYPYAEVAYTLDSRENKKEVPIYFEIDSDSLVRLGNVIITGFKNFPEYTGRRELRLKKGNIYRRIDILDSHVRLVESGFFSTFTLDRSDSLLNRLKPDFVLNVRERKPYFLSLQTGARQSEERDLLWDISSSFGKRNLFGSRRIELLTDFSFGVGQDSRLLVHRYRARFTEPWFLGIRMPLAITGELNPELRDATQDFDKQSWAITAATHKRFGRTIRSNLGFEYQSVDISGIPDDQLQSIKEQAGNSARRKLYFNIRRDSRDDLFVPRRGSVTEFAADYFGGFLGGDENFFKIEASWSGYKVLWPGWVGAARFKVGWTEEFGVSDLVPTDELLFVGGANTVRGFVENSLGPLDPDGDPRGARIIFLLNQEFRWKTIQILKKIPLLSYLMRNMPLWQSVFVDMGNGFDRRTQINLDNFAYSYGTGIQIISPAGPIRLDYARRVPTRRYGFESRIHFTILYAF